MTQPTEQDRPMSAIEDMLLKFTSGNDIAVQRAIVTLDEWRATYAEHMALQARVAELEAERDELLSRLPDGMKHCTIVFKECEKGHGWLTATNWVQHGCPTCERDELRRRVDDAESDRTRAANLIAALETELSVYRNECTNVHTNKIKADAVREACDKVVSDYRAVSFDKNDNLYLNIIALRDYAGQIEREGGV